VNCDASLSNRIKRAQGQMGGVLSMMDNNATCEDIVTQLKAIRSSVDKVIALLTTANLVQTIEKQNDVKLDNITEALNLIIKNM
jgi:CsoR family transcriptional regulator, copper-sensing transcriptional repressor